MPGWVRRDKGRVSPESLELGCVSDVPDAGGVLPEVGLHLVVHRVLWGDHQGGVVTHLTQVLQGLWEGGRGRMGRMGWRGGEGGEDGREKRVRREGGRR